MPKLFRGSVAAEELREWGEAGVKNEDRYVECREVVATSEWDLDRKLSDHKKIGVEVVRGRERYRWEVTFEVIAKIIR